jgi:nickel/cobalt exporter
VADPLSLLYLPVAIGLGALHALEPGHSKTLMAAYLIGTKGTKRDAVLLGLSAATTHSIVVIALAVTALYLGKEAFTDQATHWLQIGSGVIVICIGLWLLWLRWPRKHRHAHHQHAPDPVAIASASVPGQISIVDTPAGERMRYACAKPTPAGLRIQVCIDRAGSHVEILDFEPLSGETGVFQSTAVPAEPHEFAAAVILSGHGAEERHAFTMQEPEGHGDHAHLDEDAHACAHAEAMPAYAKEGVSPSPGQVIAFGAAGGLIPCPASITVMLLALSIGKVAIGVVAVLCFSFGLAVTLVGIGLAVVTGLSRVAQTGRFSWFTERAGLISAGLVMATGIVALAFAH